MRGPVLIVGQGLAGTALGLELEAAGLPFVIASDGHATAASRVAAGLINPVTGQRFVKSWRVDELLPLARAAYARWERVLGVALWHAVEIDRRYLDAQEATRGARKLARGELAPYAAAADVDTDGLLLRGAARITLPELLVRAEARWESAGVLRRARVDAADLRFGAGDVTWCGEQFAAVVLATGAGPLARELFVQVKWVPVKGQILTVRADGIRRGRVLHRKVWLLGERDGEGRMGATYERGREDLNVTDEARLELLATARALLPAPIEVVGQAAGVRLVADDRLPVAGWHPLVPRLGILGALGSKGALWAPWLAQCWRDELRAGGGVPTEVSPGRLMT